MTEADYAALGIQPPKGFFVIGTGRAFKFGQRLDEMKKSGQLSGVTIITR